MFERNVKTGGNKDPDKLIINPKIVQYWNTLKNCREASNPKDIEFAQNKIMQQLFSMDCDSFLNVCPELKNEKDIKEFIIPKRITEAPNFNLIQKIYGLYGGNMQLIQIK